MTATSQTAPTSKVPDAVAADRRSNRVEPVYYAMLLPVVILFTLFITFPALVGMFYSITNYAGYGDWQFVGLTNYTTIFSDPRVTIQVGWSEGWCRVLDRGVTLV
jgi:raffinose/stachyose/melibiose transport system permease protein